MYQTKRMTGTAFSAKSLIAGLLAAALMFGLLPLSVSAGDGGYEAAETAAPAQEERGPHIAAPSAILTEGIGGTVLYEKNADEKRPPASITKIMVLLLTFEALDRGDITPDQKVCASEHASRMGGAQIWLRPGEEMTVDELIRAAAIKSANDAACQLGELVGGSEAGAVQLMNEKAAALGMTNTHFQNCTGLDEEGHYTTARDITKMAAALLTHKDITKYTTRWMDELRDGATQLVNTNKLIRFYEGATGLKTGYTHKAGFCLCATAERGGLPLISVVLGDETGKIRFDDSRALLDWGFSRYEAVTPDFSGLAAEPIAVRHGTVPFVHAKPEMPRALCLPRGAAPKIGITSEIAEELEAPAEAGQKAGKITLRLDEKIIGEYSWILSETAERMTFGKALRKMLRELVKMKM